MPSLLVPRSLHWTPSILETHEEKDIYVSMKREVRSAFAKRRNRMRIAIVASALVALVSLSMWAQQPAGQRQGQAAPPLQGGVVTAADLAAIVAKQPKDRNGNQT